VFSLYNTEVVTTLFTIVYNTIQYNTKNDFYSAVIEGAEALVGRL